MLNIQEYIKNQLVEVKGNMDSKPFLMGSPEANNTKPHPVKVNTFYMAKYPVTQELYEAVTQKDNPSHFRGKTRPVESVNWYDAVEFCNLLSEMLKRKPFYNINKNLMDENNKNDNVKLKYTITMNPDSDGFRLPTEAEWEYAARGGILKRDLNLKYAGSNDLDEVGWYDENSHAETKPVGMKKPNALGLYDMSGNVWEWCWDWYGEDYYSNSPIENPIGADGGLDRVYRGGGWGNSSVYSQSAYRSCWYPRYLYSDLGFRFVCPFQFWDFEQKSKKNKELFGLCTQQAVRDERTAACKEQITAIK